MTTTETWWQAAMRQEEERHLACLPVLAKLYKQFRSGRLTVDEYVAAVARVGAQS